jgi:hypothetical protein
MRIPNPFPPAGAALFALALAAPIAAAQAPRTAPAPAVATPLAEEPAPAGAARPKPRRAANPLYPQIAAMLEAEREQIAALRVRLAATHDGDAAMAIQREIEHARAQTELGILRLQADHARKAGRTAVADGLDAAIRHLTQPPVRLQPAARPAPAVDATPTPTR